MDLVARLVRDCQVAAGAWVPPVDILTVLGNIRRILSALPEEIPPEAKGPVCVVLYDIARHTLREHIPSDSMAVAASGPVRLAIRAIELILHEQEGDLKTRPSGIARSLRVSRTHLSHTVTVCSGECLGRQIEIIRTLRAVTLLVETERPIKQIAEAVGFRRTAQLDRQFRRWIHITPTELRCLFRTWVSSRDTTPRNRHTA
jgi:AraC-like DNA-binding protein